MKSITITLLGITLGVSTLIACVSPSQEKQCYETIDSRGNIIYYCDDTEE